MIENKSTVFAKCELKFAESAGEFSGYGSVFGNLDSKNDIIMPGAYANVIKKGNAVPVFVNHGWVKGDLPIGLWSNLKEDTKGLFGSANLVMQMPSATNAYWAMKSGLVGGLSVAIIPDHSSVERKSDGSRVIHNIEHLEEISIVTKPANEAATVVSLKFREELDDIKTVRDFENFLRDAGNYSKGAAQAMTAKAKELFSMRDADEQTEAEKLNALILARITKLTT